jgi:ATP-dependent Clp protease protease subunit
MTGQPVEKLAADVERDYFMTASEACEYGLIDEVFENKPEEDEPAE